MFSGSRVLYKIMSSISSKAIELPIPKLLLINILIGSFNY